MFFITIFIIDLTIPSGDYFTPPLLIPFPSLSIFPSIPMYISPLPPPSPTKSLRALHLCIDYIISSYHLSVFIPLSSPYIHTLYCRPKFVTSASFSSRTDLTWFPHQIIHHQLHIRILIRILSLFVYSMSVHSRYELKE